MTKSPTVRMRFLFVIIVCLTLIIPAVVSAAPAQIVARTGQPAVDVAGWTYNGFFNDNASTPTVLPAPMFAGDLVTAFSTLRQGANIPATDKGIWFFNQTGSGGRKIARVGENAPGTSPTTVFSLLNSINAGSTGRALFIAILTGPDVDDGVDGDSAGVWEANNQSTNLVLRRGTQAPETELYPGQWGHFNSFNSIFSARTGILDGTAGSDVLIDTIITGQNIGTSYGIWGRVGQTFEMLYWTVGYIPEIPNVFRREAWGTFSSSGRGAYAARFDGSGVTTVTINGYQVTNNYALWRSGPGYEQLIARTGSQAPGIAYEAIFSVLSQGNSSLPSVNAQGDVVFSATLATSTARFGLWKSTAQGTTLIAREGMTPATAVGPGVFLSGFQSFDQTTGRLWSMNNGDIIFAAGLTGSGVTLSNYASVYKISANGTHTLIARAGVANPDLPAGVTLVRTTLPRVMKASGNDHVMFTAQFAGTNITTANDDVLLRHTDVRGLELIAQEGQQIGNFILKSFVNNGADMQLTDNYYAVVPANFSPASNPTAQPSPGFLGISPTGERQVIAVRGYPIELSDGTTPILTNFGLSLKNALNTSGKVVFSALFTATPRDEAVLVAQIGGETPPACAADFDNNGTVEVSDIFAFLSAWFAQNLSADTNENGTVAVDDIFAFLSLWFAGC